MVTYREKWRSQLIADLGPEGWHDIIGKLKVAPFTEWERNWDPGGTAEGYLGYAVDISCGDSAHPYVSEFLKTAVLVVSRAENDSPRWLPSGDWGNPEGRHGLLRGKFLRAKALSEAWSGNVEIDYAMLSESARHMLVDCGSVRGTSLWDASSQSRQLSAVELLLIAGDVKSAQAALGKRKHYRASQTYFDWLSRLLEQLSDTKTDRWMEELTAHFDSFFDPVRDPDWASQKGSLGFDSIEPPSILRLQLALMKHRVLLGKDLRNRWGEVIELIRA